MIGRIRQIHEVTSWVHRQRLGDDGILMMTGPTATGKSSVLSQVAQDQALRIETVDCVRYCSEKTLVRRLGTIYSVEEERRLPHGARLDRVSDLVERCRGPVQEEVSEMMVVLDRVERLCGGGFRATMLVDLIEMFRRLPRHRRGLPVLVSERSLVSICGWLPVPVCTVVEFPGYRREEVQEILVGHCREGFVGGESWPHDFVRLLLDVVFQACIDLRELTRFCDALFPRYCDAAKRDGVTSEEVYRSVLPQLRRALRNLYREDLDAVDDDEESNRGRLVAAFPLSAKYILVAAYLASKNPQKHDLRYFTKNLTGRRVRRGIRKPASRVTSRTVELDSERRSFPLERLLAIVGSLCYDQRDEPIRLSMFGTSLLPCITTLARMRLLEPRGLDLSEQKYTCRAPRDLIDAISKDIGIDLAYFLHYE